MRTVCPNLECGQFYRIKPERIGSVARCKKCSTVFRAVEYIEPGEQGVNEIQDEQQEKPETDVKKKRKTVKEVMEEKKEKIVNEVDRIMPILMDSFDKKENESDTRLIINAMLQHILGYDISDIKTELKIKGKKADYVLNVKDKGVIIIEAKRIGMNLGERQIFQASSYGMHAGIKWILLTNAVVWELYRISYGEKIESTLVFTIDLLDGLDNEEAECFYLISKYGMSRKNLLEDQWKKIQSLSNENITDAILSDGVISKIRTVLTKQTGYKKITNDELRQTIEENIFELS